LATAATTFETTIDASLSAVGYNLNSGATPYANLAAAQANAYKAWLATKLAAAMTEQAAISAARDQLRINGDYGPA
jgi:hypothetical protein